MTRDSHDTRQLAKTSCSQLLVLTITCWWLRVCLLRYMSEDSRFVLFEKSILGLSAESNRQNWKQLSSAVCCWIAWAQAAPSHIRNIAYGYWKSMSRKNTSRALRLIPMRVGAGGQVRLLCRNIMLFWTASDARTTSSRAVRYPYHRFR